MKKYCNCKRPLLVRWIGCLNLFCIKCKKEIKNSERIALKYKNIPTQRLRNSFATLLRYHLKRKKDKTFNLVGYSLDNLKKHLEKQFNVFMNWDNYGNYWVIDHIKPCRLFNMENDIQFMGCWNLNNLRPLSKEDNLRKGGRYASTQK